MSASAPSAPSYVRLVSSDGFEYIIQRKAAFVSGTLRSMFRETRAFSEGTQNKVVLPDISGNLLEKVCEYLYYNLRYSESSTTDIPEFEIPPEMALELLVVSDYLDV